MLNFRILTSDMRTIEFFLFFLFKNALPYINIHKIHKLYP